MAQETDSETIARLEREIEELKAENERLRRALEEALRAAQRQAAPFSRRHPKAHPQKPGRKAGQDYGLCSRREIPDSVDEVVEVPLPARCPHCGGGVEETGVVSQYQTEIPQPRVERIEFRIHRGRCRRCRQAVQGRHRRQSSQAVGSAASQLGPRAIALATQLNKGLGLPYGKTAAVLEQGWGLEVSRGGLCQAIERVARKAEPTYEALRERIRTEPSVTADETGWKVGGQLWWMWVCSSPRMTVYAIQPGRGFEQAATVLGEGFLVRDGWSVYRQFGKAVHQTCLAHLLRRCREMIPVARTGGARFPRAIQTLLQSGLRLRDRRDQEQISPHGLAVARGQLETRLDRVLERRTGCRIHLPVLPGIRSDQLAGRTSHPPDGGHPQGLGRKPNCVRSPCAKHLTQPSRNLPPAPAARSARAGAPALFASTTGVQSDDSAPTGTLNKYKM